MLKKKKQLVIPSDGKDVEQLELSYIASGNAKWHRKRKRFGRIFFFKLNINLLYDLV